MTSRRREGTVDRLYFPKFYRGLSLSGEKERRIKSRTIKSRQFIGDESFSWSKVCDSTNIFNRYFKCHQCRLRRLEESEKKRQAMMQAMKDQSKAKGPNFTITKKDLSVGLRFSLCIISLCPGRAI